MGLNSSLAAAVCLLLVSKNEKLASKRAERKRRSYKINDY